MASSILLKISSTKATLQGPNFKNDPVIIGIRQLIQETLKKASERSNCNRSNSSIDLAVSACDLHRSNGHTEADTLSVMCADPNDNVTEFPPPAPPILSPDENDALLTSNEDNVPEIRENLPTARITRKISRNKRNTKNTIIPKENENKPKDGESKAANGTENKSKGKRKMSTIPDSNEKEPYQAKKTKRKSGERPNEMICVYKCPKCSKVCESKEEADKHWGFHVWLEKINANNHS